MKRPEQLTNFQENTGKPNRPACCGPVFFLIVLQRSFALRLALQQAENVLLGCVGLGQHRGGRLLQDLVFGQVCGFQSKICILDAAFGSRQVGRDVGQVVHSVVQPVGDRTQFRPLIVDVLDGIVDCRNGSGRI